MFSSSFKVATVWGTPIRLHISLLLIIFVYSRSLPIQWAIPAAIGLITSIVLHELGYSLVAIKKGCRVRQITLMILGGAAQMEGIPSRPIDEFLMAIAGPLVSLALAITTFMMRIYIPLPRIPNFPGNIFILIAITNLGLLIFNLLPAFPMDGGRVLRALLATRMPRLKATFLAARISQLLAIIIGVLAIQRHEWILLFIMIFIFSAANNEYRMLKFHEAAKRHHRAYSSTAPPPPPPPPLRNSGHDTHLDDQDVIISKPPYSPCGQDRATIHRS